VESSVVKQFLITVAGVLTGILLCVILLPFLLIGMLSASFNSQPPQPNHMVLSLDLREPLTDQRPANPFAAFSGSNALLDQCGRNFSRLSVN